MGILISFVIIVLGISAGIWILIDWLKFDSTRYEKIWGILLFFSFFVFVIVLKFHTTPYFKEIDPFVDPCYSPISYENSELLIITHLMSIGSLIMLYLKGVKLPPILISLFIIFVTVGIISDLQFLYQISHHDTSRIPESRGESSSLYLSFYPILLIVTSVGIFIRLVKSKAKINSQIEYKNKILNTINRNLVASQNLPLYSLMLTIPFLLSSIIILVLFGQDFDAFTKVYTETATWKYSQYLHPPTVNDRHGHYLCTVAAFGNPNIVKPIGVGRRNNKLIIVNRQLQIANSFEFMIEKISPVIHHCVRTNYDKYGINLARRINNERLSNITYILMKPIEWLFLIFLYLYFIEPEKVISRQYKCAP